MTEPVNQPIAVWYGGAVRRSYTPFDPYTTWLPDQVFRAFTDAINAAPRWWETDDFDGIEASIYDAIAGRLPAERMEVTA